MTAISLQELHAQGPFLRRLARALVRDEAAAEDLVQETWVVALRGLHGPREGEGERGWLARLLKSRARSARRGEARRRARELAAGLAHSHARKAEEAGTRETEITERVLTAVLALEEPYRGLVLRRYYHDNTPTQIARDLDRPLKTVESQLARARAALRVELDESCGGRRAWSVALVGLAGLERPAPLAGGALIGAIAAAVLGVTLAGFHLAGLGGTEDEADATLVAAGANLASHQPTERVDREIVSPGDPYLARIPEAHPIVSEVPVEALSIAATEADPVARIEGRVVSGFVSGVDDEPWVSVVGLDKHGGRVADPVNAPCDEDGRFTLALPLRGASSPVEVVELTAVARDVVPVTKRFGVRAGPLLIGEVVLDNPGAAAFGVVRDDADAPLVRAEVHVAVDTPGTITSIGPHTLFGNAEGHTNVRVFTDEDGRFRVAGLARWRHKMTVVQAAPPEPHPWAGVQTIVLDAPRAGVFVTPGEGELALRPTLEEFHVQVLGVDGPLSDVQMAHSKTLRDFAEATQACEPGSDPGPKPTRWRLDNTGRVRILADLESTSLPVFFVVRSGYRSMHMSLAAEADYRATFVGGGEADGGARRVEIELMPDLDPPKLFVEFDTSLVGEHAAGTDEPLNADGALVTATPRSPLTQVFVTRVDGTAAGDPATVEFDDMAAGVWDVTVTPTSPDHTWVRTEKTVYLEREGTAFATIALSQGARVRLSLPGSESEHEVGAGEFHVRLTSTRSRGHRHGSPGVEDGRSGKELVLTPLLDEAGEPREGDAGDGVALHPPIPTGRYLATVVHGEVAIAEREIEVSDCKPVVLTLSDAELSHASGDR